MTWASRNRALVLSAGSLLLLLLSLIEARRLELLLIEDKCKDWVSPGAADELFTAEELLPDLRSWSAFIQVLSS